jgi:hypothetical protein
MLQVDPEKRISLTHIAHHPWVRNHDGWQHSQLVSMESTDSEEKRDVHIDTAIAKDICGAMGVEMEHLKKIVTEHQVGPIYATYRLMEKAKNRNLRKIPFEDSQASIPVCQSHDDSSTQFQMLALEQRLPIHTSPSRPHYLGKRHATLTVLPSHSANHPIDPFADVAISTSLNNNTLGTIDPNYIKEGHAPIRENRVFSDSPGRSKCPDTDLTLVNGVFDVEIVSSKDPEHMMKAMISATVEHEIHFESISEYMLRCFVEDKLQNQGELVIFEMEICRIRSLPLNGIRFRQISDTSSIYQGLFPGFSLFIQDLLN